MQSERSLNEHWTRLSRWSSSKLNRRKSTNLSHLCGKLPKSLSESREQRTTNTFSLISSRHSRRPPSSPHQHHQRPTTLYDCFSSRRYIIIFYILWMPFKDNLHTTQIFPMIINQFTIDKISSKSSLIFDRLRHRCWPFKSIYFQFKSNQMFSLDMNMWPKLLPISHYFD